MRSACRRHESMCSCLTGCSGASRQEDACQVMTALVAQMFHRIHLKFIHASPGQHDLVRALCQLLFSLKRWTHATR
ncbi:hypothetical protein DUNSADRAFT_2683 [Dunaliella salina]|uniref:Uncharacterized protein n=1 Tax=Dunaliella salina TaxID=3046 RepID=A0ABQ7H889_DUNSA|nr:hypothetical protein DUNSADRAFT_2683 [Dunaliella salina]|eukprot:KAF5843070.1 hypothetical protein DUNSADRAFT_2683 [Dunaliella salina]